MALSTFNTLQSMVAVALGMVLLQAVVAPYSVEVLLQRFLYKVYIFL